MLVSNEIVQRVKAEVYDEEAMKDVDPAIRPLVKAVGESSDPIAPAWSCSGHDFVGHFIILCSDIEFASKLIDRCLTVTLNKESKIRPIDLINIKKPETLGYDVDLQAIRFNFVSYVGLRSLYEIFKVPFDISDEVFTDDQRYGELSKLRRAEFRAEKIRKKEKEKLHENV